MSNLVITDVDDLIIGRLQQRAAAHGRTSAAEAKVILQEALELPPASAWKSVNAIRDELAGTGQVFGGCVELIREDRDR